jgi:aspartate/methionine/tyrosine aminotransferase
VFSTRARWDAPLNRLTIERRRRTDLLDLTETNPTHAGLHYPHEELAEALARGARAPYDPDPLGLRAARDSVAEWLGCDANDLLLTASTSEAYSFLFKLLTDPGDVVLTPAPSYPLLEHLATLELITLRSFPLELHRRWEIHDVPVDARTRAIVVVNPNNPTGSYVSDQEQDRLASHGLPIISDEVFIDYPLEGSGSTFVRDDVLTFTLGGLSKSAGLPHFKLGWIRVSGPGRRKALEALELISPTTSSPWPLRCRSHCRNCCASRRAFVRRSRSGRARTSTFSAPRSPTSRQQRSCPPKEAGRPSCACRM